MIVRQTAEEALLLIRQPDHAALAAELLAAWTAGGFPAHPRRARILAATRAHDDGWSDEDGAPVVGEDGAPVDFITAGAAVKQRVWPRAVDRLADADPYAAALVAQHALTVYADYRGHPAWTAFFDAMAARRAALLARCDGATAAAADRDYPFVRMADLLSLAFCNDWRTPVEHAGYRIAILDGEIAVAPDPFAGARVPFRIAARRVPRPPYRSSSDLRAALASAPVEYLAGTAAGLAVEP